jgi:Flp pilus assembly protein TadD
MVTEYRTRLNEAPEDHSTRYALAMAYLMVRRWDKAAQELALVIEGLPEYADAHFRLAVALAHAGDHADALVAARRAVLLEPENERYASVVGRLEALVGDGN